MIENKKIVCVIPARLRSSRFPKKIIAALSGKPLLWWAWKAALRIPFFDDVVIAVDAEETVEVIKSFGGKWIMTSESCLRGVDRLVEIQKNGLLQADIWVNWQADEPFLSFQIIKDLLQSCASSEAEIWTLKTKIEEANQIKDPNICKVVCDINDYALYFSRSPIPYNQQKIDSPMFRHIGLYAYSNSALEKISTMFPCEIEEIESLEQLRFLFHGLKIQVHETEEVSIGIDLPEHLVSAEEYVKKQDLLGLLI
ncbi:MAG: 3-deoxy-manno-octulosonate cytidylyltransferase, partial [Verrucomicrobia bacterium]|nr:3-deoxy-manno-octulosonate cytidylyltransferase [Verrucomicrobiota bacterium]